MAVAIVTGSAGLVGSESSRHFARLGMDVAGIDCDMRRSFFGAAASTRWQIARLQHDLGRRYRHYDIDVRDVDAVERLFRRFRSSAAVVVHTAAQPSHDWAAAQPAVDFSVNADGTLAVLDAMRRHAPQAVFIFTSTNKVYGDHPNALPLVELPTRWEISAEHPYADGVLEDMSIDRALHSVFGASKVAADVLVQEYGRYYGLGTVCFRAGCITGPGHSGTELHGFLAYLIKCAATGTPYTVFGYGGKQVRDNIHSADLVSAFERFYRAPRAGEVYNIGGGRTSHCSMREAIAICEQLTGRPLGWTYSPSARRGDHIWWISGLTKFQRDYPGWTPTRTVPDICREIYEANADRWRYAPVA
jgi:CDP-paratose 2-epimerase